MVSKPTYESISPTAILASKVRTQPTQPFILPFRVGQYMGTWGNPGKVNWGIPYVTLALALALDPMVEGPYPLQVQGLLWWRWPPVPRTATAYAPNFTFNVPVQLYNGQWYFWSQLNKPRVMHSNMQTAAKGGKGGYEICKRKWKRRKCFSQNIRYEGKTLAYKGSEKERE